MINMEMRDFIRGLVESAIASESCFWEVADSPNAHEELLPGMGTQSVRTVFYPGARRRTLRLSWDTRAE